MHRSTWSGQCLQPYNLRRNDVIFLMPTPSAATASRLNTLRIHSRSRRIVGIVLLIAAVCGGLWGLRAGTAYFAAHRMANQVNDWFSGQRLPDTAQLAQAMQQLEAAAQVLPHDGAVHTTLAKLYFVQGQHATSQHYFDAAHQALLAAQRARPSHFGPLALQVLVYAHTGPQQQMIDALSTVLQMAPYEKQVQEWVGPVVVQHWYSLPPIVQQQAIPMITGALREPSTREILLAAMARHNIVSPFTCCSPNRETSARLRILEAQAVNDIYQ